MTDAEYAAVATWWSADEYVAAIRDTVGHLVAMDVRTGGNQASRHATRALRTALRRLNSGAIAGPTADDVRVAVAELAELTGWLLIDANRHEPARRANRLALALARAAGDRSMELFVTHNISLQATYLRRPRSALAVIEPVLEHGRLTSRLESMFRLRAARAHAQMGLSSQAFRLLEHARSLLLDGVSERDPAWSWWISPRGLESATAAMHGCLGDWNSAIAPLHRALEATPTSATRDRFLYLCTLLHAQIELNAWRDVESTAGQLAPLIGTVGSDRPLARLATTIRHVSMLETTSAARLRRAVTPVAERVSRFAEHRGGEDVGWRMSRQRVSPRRHDL